MELSILIPCDKLIRELYRGVLISGGWNREVPLYIDRGILISGCWNRGVSLYTEMSSFQDRGVPLHTEMSSFQGEFHCIQRHPGWNRGVPLYIQRCPHFRVLE